MLIYSGREKLAAPQLIFKDTTITKLTLQCQSQSCQGFILDYKFLWVGLVIFECHNRFMSLDQSYYYLF